MGGRPRFSHLSSILHPQLWAQQQGLSSCTDSDNQPLSHPLLRRLRCPDVLALLLFSQSSPASWLTQTRLLTCLCGPLHLRCPSCPKKLHHLTETFYWSLCPKNKLTPYTKQLPHDCPPLLLGSWSQVSLFLVPSPARNWKGSSSPGLHTRSLELTRRGRCSKPQRI